MIFEEPVNKLKVHLDYADILVHLFDGCVFSIQFVVVNTLKIRNYKEEDTTISIYTLYSIIM